MLTFKDFSVHIGTQQIIKNIALTCLSGQLVTITGANGGGKSTLVAALMGLSGYECQGEILLNGQSIIDWPVEKRAQAGIFLAHQHPVIIPGLRNKIFLQHAYRACKGTALPLSEIDKKIAYALERVGLPEDFIDRQVHDGFSGGQRKRFELAQMLVLEPRIIILDEIDSGLDAAGLQMVTTLIAEYRTAFPETIFLVITHNSLFSQALVPDASLQMHEGQLV